MAQEEVREYDRDSVREVLRRDLSEGGFEYVDAKLQNHFVAGSGAFYLVVGDAGKKNGLYEVNGAKILKGGVVRSARFRLRSGQTRREHGILTYLNAVGCPNIPRLGDLIVSEEEGLIGFGIGVDERAVEAGIEGPKLAVAEVLYVVQKLLMTLDVMHKAGIYHRDIKSSNVLLIRVEDEDSGLFSLQVQLVDFNISRADEALPHLCVKGEGTLQGTPKNMSPEMAREMKISRFDDLWGMGILLCELLTGVHPFMFCNPSVKGVNNILSVVRREWIDFDMLSTLDPFNQYPELLEVVKKALSFYQGARYQSAEEFIADLNRVSIDYSLYPTNLLENLYEAIELLDLMNWVRAVLSDVFQHADDSGEWEAGEDRVYDDIPDGRVVSRMKTGVEQTYLGPDSRHIKSKNLAQEIAVLKVLKDLDTVPELTDIYFHNGRVYGFEKTHFFDSHMSLREYVEEALCHNLDNVDGWIKETMVAVLFVDILKKLDEIHSCGVAHRMISSEALRVSYVMGKEVLTDIKFDHFHGAGFVDAELNLTGDLLTDSSVYSDGNRQVELSSDIYSVGQCLLSTLACLFQNKTDFKSNVWSDSNLGLENLRELGVSDKMIGVIEKVINQNKFARIQNCSRFIRILRAFIIDIQESNIS